MERWMLHRNEIQVLLNEMQKQTCSDAVTAVRRSIDIDKKND